MISSRKAFLGCFVGLCNLTVVTASGTWPQQGCKFTGYKVESGIHLRHAADSQQGMITIELTYEGAAWLGFAFAESMIGASAVIGLPDDVNPPVKYNISDYDITGITPNGHKIEGASVVQNYTHTVLTYTQAFKESGQKKLQIGSTSNFIWAVGWDNTLAMHARQGYSQIQISDCRQGSTTKAPSSYITPRPTTNAPTYHPNPYGTSQPNYYAPPTHAPAKPTNFPTTIPTVQPTSHPTTLPPTKVTTEQPTQAPTGKPSQIATETPTPSQEQDGSIRRAELSLQDGLIRVTLESNPTNRSITVEMSYEGQAWLGFAASRYGGMVGSTAVIALPDEADSITNPGKYYLGGMTVGAVQLLGENRQTLTSTFLSQNGTHTVMRFTKPFDDEGEVGIDINGLNTFIYAVGSGNSLGVHSISDQFQIDWTQEPKETAAPSPVPIAATPAPVGVTAEGGSFQTELSFESGAVQIAMETKFRSKFITVDMTVEGAVWIGWAPSDGGFMVGSTAIIALPDEPLGPTNPGKYYLGGTSLDAIQLLEDKHQTLTNTLIEQNETHTRMKFSKLLEEDGETPILFDQENIFIYATGFGNPLGLHRTHNSFSVDFLSGSVGAVEDYQSLWALHGLLMSISWGILVPMGIGFSLLRDVLPFPPSVWFVLHRSLNLTAFACTFAAFWIAFSNVAKAANDAGENPDHFTRTAHRKVGLAIMVIVIVHVAWALLRPHGQKKVASSDNTGDGGRIIDISEENPAVETVKNEAPLEEKTFVRRSWEAAHRFLGVTLLGMSWYNCYSGIEAFALKFGEKYSKTGVFWGIAGGLAGLVIALSLFDRVRKKLIKE